MTLGTSVPRPVQRGKATHFPIKSASSIILHVSTSPAFEAKSITFFDFLNSGREKSFFFIISLFLSALFFLISGFSPLFGESHSLFTRVLRDHVRDGWVNYRPLKEDSRLEAYIRQLAGTDPKSLPSEKEKLAFWINAYNAYTLKIITDNYPVKSIKDLPKGGGLFKGSIWDKKLVIINNRETTLNTIEHKIIRPVFKEPRIHFALVCAAKSCPPLRSEAYEAARLDEQLDDQARIFLNNKKKNSFNPKIRKASLSMIFRWFGKDFARKKEDLLRYLARYLPAEVAASIRERPEKWSVSHKRYDWSLNER